MIIQEFNFFLKSVQNINTLKSDLITKLNRKCDGDNTGYIANVYDISNKKKYLLVSDNVKSLNSLTDNLFEFNSDVRNIDLSEYYTKTQSENKFATKEEVANIQAGEGVDLLGYITEELADGKYALKTEIGLKVDKDSVYNKNEIDEKFRTINISESVDLKNYYTKEEVENKLATLSLTPEDNSKINQALFSIETLTTDVFGLTQGLTSIQKDNVAIKQNIENVYNTLYKKILEVEKLYKGDKTPVVDNNIPKLESIESEAEKPSVVDTFLEDDDISIVDTREDKNPALKDFDDVVIFD
ncbi:hypothetical protein [Campylobacter fetus]|uniref:hypothetical protein n=1 Tax=Campylobacter fetus TaxID=196 RepID=UPI00168D130D|nr:hypothetical protein [Campylobacter fetus]MBD3865200.1 hypothetical protein [Campylobacter fetus]